MATQWFCQIGGQQYGPVDFPALQAWGGEGRIQPDDLVWSEGMPNWQPAKTIPGLLTAPIGTAPTGINTGIPPVSYAAESAKVPGIITIPLLISAIWNCLAALGWLSTCFGVIITIPLVILLIFEFILYSELNNPTKIVSPSKVKTIAICEIVAGLVSLAPLVCGIIILANLGNVNINKGKMPQ